MSEKSSFGLSVAIHRSWSKWTWESWFCKRVLISFIVENNLSNFNSYVVLIILASQKQYFKMIPFCFCSCRIFVSSSYWTKFPWRWSYIVNVLRKLNKDEFSGLLVSGIFRKQIKTIELTLIIYFQHRLIHRKWFHEA